MNMRLALFACVWNGANCPNRGHINRSLMFHEISTGTHECYQTMKESRSMTHLPKQGQTNSTPKDLNRIRYFWYHHMSTE